MKMTTRTMTQITLAFLLLCTTACQNVVNDMARQAIRIEKLGRIAIANAVFLPLPQISLTYDTGASTGEAFEGDLVYYGATKLEIPRETTFTITNEGKEALTVHDIALSELDDDPRFTLGGITFPLVIDPGTSNTFTITFQSTVVGDGYREAIVSINTGEENRLFILSVACERTEDPLAVLLVLLPGPATVNNGDMHDMGVTDTVPAGPTVTFTVSNLGTDDSTLVINSVTTSDPLNQHFNVVSAPSSLAYGASGSIEISFEPPVTQSTEEYSDDMTISYEDGVHPTATFTVHLEGTMTPVPEIEVYDTAVSDDDALTGSLYTYNFDPQHYNTQSSARVFRIKSSRTKDLAINSIVSNNTNFIVSPTFTTPQVLAAGASMNVNIYYYPKTAGDHAGAVTITSDAQNTGTFTINLTGKSSATQVQLADPYTANYGAGQFQNSLTALVDDRGVELSYTYNTSIAGIYDTGTSGDMASGRYMRIVCNGQNVASIIGLTTLGDINTGVGLVPFAMNLTNTAASPPAGRFYIDPATGKYMLPRPIYWSKFATSTPGTPNPNQNGTVPAEITLYGYSSIYSTTYPGTNSPFFNHVPGGGYNDGSLVHLCWDKTPANNRFYIYPFGNPGVTNLSKGTLSVLTRVGHDLGEADVNVYIGNHFVQCRIDPFTYPSGCLFIGYTAPAETPLQTHTTTDINCDWVHWYVVWDQAAGLGGGKTVRAFWTNGVASGELSSTHSFTTGSISLKGIAWRDSDNHGSDSAGFDDLKIWDHIILPGGTIAGRAWDNVYNSTDSGHLHYIYGSENNYRPDVVGAPNGVGYYKLP